MLRRLPDVSPTTVALAFLLVVLGTATVGRLWAAIVVSVAAMLTLNFFFLPPLGTFTIADPQNWIALVRVPRRCRHRQQPLGSGTGARIGSDRQPQRGHTTVRSDARRAVDDRNRRRDRRAGAPRRPAFRAAEDCDLPAHRPRLAHSSGGQRRRRHRHADAEHGAGQGAGHGRVRRPPARLRRPRADRRR